MIVSVDKQFHVQSVRAVALIVSRGVWCLAHLVPYVEADPVSHSAAVYRHGIANPAVFCAYAEEADVEVGAIFIRQFQVKRFLVVCQRRCSAIAQCTVVEGCLLSLSAFLHVAYFYRSVDVGTAVEFVYVNCNIYQRY